jgi:CubicO group peptidase (beta-lactamase class C family)
MRSQYWLLICMTLLPQLAIAGSSATVEKPAGRVLGDRQGNRIGYQEVNYGFQAVTICNGLFVSGRSLEQVYEYELQADIVFRGESPLPAKFVEINEEQKTVRVGRKDQTPGQPMWSVYREGLGCVVMSPDQELDVIDSLPRLLIKPPPLDAANIAWPFGDRVIGTDLPPGVDEDVLQAASEWAFDRERNGHPSQHTRSVMVTYQGTPILERYADDVNQNTMLRAWSASKSMASALAGIGVKKGLLALDAPLPFPSWGPYADERASQDPRRKITLKNIVQMSSGLFPVDDERCDLLGSCLVYFAGTSVDPLVLDRGLVQFPGVRWNYENGDTLALTQALKIKLNNPRESLEFPYRELFWRIGMRNTMILVDRFGNHISSSGAYTTARDLTRFGLLHLNGGKWGDEQILPEWWADFVTTPAASTEHLGRHYGGQWWLVPDNYQHIPADTYAARGARGQLLIVVPSYDLIIVRMGDDAQHLSYKFSPWDLTREIIKALPDRTWGSKPTGAKNVTK